MNFKKIQYCNIHGISQSQHYLDKIAQKRYIISRFQRSCKETTMSISPQSSQSILNPSQLEAVQADPKQNLLILAGAGSGKTRVVIERILYLIEHCQVDPYNILAVTFTNKAANEMKQRLSQGSNKHFPLSLGTFHSQAHRMIRQKHELAKLGSTFQILDSEDQQRLIKRVTRQMNVDDKVWTPQESQRFISHQKELARRPNHVPTQHDPKTKQLTAIYEAYEQACRQSDLIDFTEILFRCYEMLKNNPDLLEHYQSRFQYILVDEFQDTNTIQYLWLKLLYARKKTAMMVVGDDDQSIYGWRGAKIENIHSYAQDFPNVTTIKLEQNYRSTSVILEASNALISHNNKRLGKKLWTESATNDPIQLYEAFNEVDESAHIVDKIKAYHKQGTPLEDMAILYRSNAQSRVLEENLLHANLPYKVYGGMRFFERAEIKDALAYLRLSQNPQDNAAFDRIVNLPSRGIGDKTLSYIRDVAAQQDVPWLDASKALLEQKSLTTRAHNALKSFVDLMDQLSLALKDKALSEQIKTMVELTQLEKHYLKIPGEKGAIKIENLNELINAGASYTPLLQQDQNNPLSSFLADTSLDTGESAQSNPHAVQLMTIHSAKGLEFEVVFLSGMEDELFPPRFATLSSERIEEERRLCYVAMTRAKKTLHLSYARVRRVFGESRSHHESRFLGEIPQKLIEKSSGQRNFSRPLHYRPKNLSIQTPKQKSPTKTLLEQWSIGQKVSHPKFGHGTITGYEGQGESLKLQIRFAKQETKWLMASLAKIDKL